MVWHRKRLQRFTHSDLKVGVGQRISEHGFTEGDLKGIFRVTGFASFGEANGVFRRMIGVCMPLYAVTDWLGLIPIAFAMGFSILGFCS